MKFTLDFKSDNYGKKQIDEPFGTSDINFSLKQKEGGLGRDVSFSGDEIQFEFTHMQNHELKQGPYSTQSQSQAGHHLASPEDAWWNRHSKSPGRQPYTIAKRCMV